MRVKLASEGVLGPAFVVVVVVVEGASEVERVRSSMCSICCVQFNWSEVVAGRQSAFKEIE